MTVGISIALCFYLVTMDHRKNTSLAYDPDFLTTNFFEAKCQQSHKQRLKTMNHVNRMNDGIEPRERPIIK